MEKKKMNSVAAMAMVFLILLSANIDTVGVAAQGVNCYDNCNTGCAGLPSKQYIKCDKKCHKRCGDAEEYLICDNKCHERCGDESKIYGNLVESD
ncbi:uncharacterized protein LOC107027143 isoform X2 [Solanum pennellii]|uniref:Uncharacterized protein LOC107027143 isoform X2 n=1 Tax=Solanum pennellii TaxID=28526 RepID=A0ABM1VEE8_SOLPN|nr:uncharacterized protein LOC107027143 isoform X2 [Solanum pennellii]